MGGYLGIGNSSAKTDRGNQLAATEGDWTLFNQGLGLGTTGQATGTGTLNTALNTLQPAQDYFQSQLKAGRTQTAQNAAPAVNAALASGDATRRAEATGGTGRTGGTASINREAGATATSNIDNIINSTLMTQKEQGAQGLEGISGAQAGIGGTQLNNALSLLGLSSNAVNDILSNATESRGQSYKINQDTQGQFGQLLGTLLLAGGL